MFCQQTSFNKCSNNLHSLLPLSEASGSESLVFASFSSASLDKAHLIEKLYFLLERAMNIT